MKIVQKQNALHAKKPNGPEVWYYLFKEYEVHYNEQLPHTTQTWHYHERINETLFLIEGELVIRWKSKSGIEEQIVKAGDLVETEQSDHTFENQSDEIAKFLVIKQLLSGEDKTDILKNDKIVTDY
jgi:uncharacterized cupin superfamily protein